MQRAGPRHHLHVGSSEFKLLRLLNTQGIERQCEHANSNSYFCNTALEEGCTRQTARKAAKKGKRKVIHAPNNQFVQQANTRARFARWFHIKGVL